MSDLASMNTELMEIERVMGAYRLDVSNKQADIKRLNQALTKLEGNKADYQEQKSLCLEPEFTKKTLHGENEKDIEGFRTDVLEKSFTDIPENKISKVEDEIREQIEIIEKEITSLNSSITSLETDHTRVSEKKAEVKRKQ